MIEKHRPFMKWLGLEAVVLMAFLPVLLGVWSCQAGGSGKMETIRIGATPGEANALVYIAADRRLFSRNGLAVTIQNFDTPPAAMDALNRGEADLAIAGEFAVVGQALRREPIRVVTSISEVASWYMISRQGLGIDDITALEGRRIGLSRRTSAEFHLGRSLDAHGLRVAEVTLVDLRPSQWAEAIGNGSIDAVMVTRPYVGSIQERLPGGAIVRPMQGDQPIFSTISGRSDWTTRHPERVKRVLESLAQAEDYLVRHPQEARAIVQKRLQPDGVHLESIWPEYLFSLSLGLSLVIAMTEQARWMIANHLSDEEAAPDFQEYVTATASRPSNPRR